jgi:hypothetical protein
MDRTRPDMERVPAVALLLLLRPGLPADASKPPAPSATGKLEPCHMAGVDEEVRKV